jgi:hypothetical protein
MLQLFRIILRSLCSNDESVLTKQMSVQLSTAWVRARNCRLPFWQQSPTPGGGGHALRAACLPRRLMRRDTPHQPKSSSLASACPRGASRQSWRHRGLEPRRRGLLLPAPSPGYRPKYGVFGPLSSSPHHNHATPFFSRLDRLTIQDSRAWLRMTANGPAHLLAQPSVNPLPSSIQPPVAKISVDSLPRGKIMRQEAPLAPCPQDIEDGIDYLSPPVLSRPSSAFDWRNQGGNDLPFFLSQIRWIIGSGVHPPILPTFKTTS